MTRSGQTLRGRISCGKSAGGAEIESWWESLFALRAEMSAKVKWFETQPLRFPTYLCGLTASYTPDAAVGLATGEDILVEVKRQKELRSADMLARLTANRRAIRQHGVRLLVSTDAELDRREENERMRGVKIHRRTYTARETEALDGRLHRYTTLTFDEAVAVVGCRAAVMHLIAVQRFYLDYRQSLEGNSVISRFPTEAMHEVELFHCW